MVTNNGEDTERGESLSLLTGVSGEDTERWESLSHKKGVSGEDTEGWVSLKAYDECQWCV